MHVPTTLFGLLYGLSLTVSMHYGLLALSAGPMALTSMIAAMSMIIPFLWGLLFWGESLGLFAIFGILLLIVAIGMICSPKKGNCSGKWIVYCLITFCANGICSVIQKYHQLHFPGGYQVEFLLTAMLLVTLCTMASQFLQKQARFCISGLGAISGIMNSIANFIVLILSATENATRLFPVVSVFNVIAACLTGLLLFREKMKFFQLLGIIIGLIGIVFLKV